ncbi:MAG: hypothetical protein R6V50_01635 [Thermoplasmatota archaeon]
MKFIQRFIHDDWARIPFSLIGIILLIGSSFTTVYIAQLEEQKAKEISWTVETNEIQTIIYYVEADLARLLNYAACKAFNEVGKNPVVTPQQDTIFYQKAAPYGGGKVTNTDVNLNIVRFLSYKTFKTMVEDNFQNNSYKQGDFMITVSIPDSWEYLVIQDITFLQMNRQFDNILNLCEKDYPVYPVFRINMTLTVYDMNKQQNVYEKKPAIITIITNRYLLLEQLTNEYDNRLNGSYGSLGINCLIAALPLTLIRGFTQHFNDKPLNIISSKWLEIITNGGILLEQGFVFNSVDPLGVVYVGYETTLAILNDLDVEIPDATGILSTQVSMPIGTKNMQERYNDILDNYDLNEYILEDDDLSFSIDANISMISEVIADEFFRDPNGKILETFVKGYSADLYTRVHRKKQSGTDNQNEIDSKQKELFKESLEDEKLRIKAAEDAANGIVDEGWWVIEDSIIYISNQSVTINYPYKGNWVFEKDPSSNAPPLFNNSQVPVILGGECWDVYLKQDWLYIWKTRSKWTGMQTNGTYNKTLGNFNIEWKEHESSHMYYETQWVNISFESDEFSKYNTTKNDIVDPFKQISFNGNVDPNLEYIYEGGASSLLEFYMNLIDFENVRDTLLISGSGEIYKNDFPVSIDQKTYQYSHLMYPSWIFKKIHEVIISWMHIVNDNIQADMAVNQDMPAHTIEQTLTNNLLTEFTDKRNKIWNDILKSQYKSDNKFNNVASKVLFHVVEMYLDAIESELENIADQTIIQDTINQALDAHDFSYTEMQDDADTMKSLSKNLPIDYPLGWIVNLKHDSGMLPDGWVESFQVAVTQRPSFLSNATYTDYYSSTDEHSEEEKCEIRYQNINVFSPGSEIDKLLKKGFNAVNQQISNALDSGFDKLEEISDEGKKQEIEVVLNKIVDKIYQQLKNNIGTTIIEELKESAQLQHLNVDVDDLAIDTIVIDIIEQSYDQGNAVFANHLNSSYFADETISALETKIGTMGLGEVEQAVKNAVSSQINSIYQLAITETIHNLRDILKDQFNILSEKLEEWASDEISKIVSQFIPAGLPILPYIGWIITLNVWYVNVYGQIPYFQVVDAYDETLSHPFWGHIAQGYERRHSAIRIDINGDGIPNYIGDNTPVDFEYKTATIAIVPPNKLTGMGDRIGGWDELSVYP